MSVIHKTAQSGFGTGTNELYDKARPSYQPMALAHIRDTVKDLTNIAEIGSGTGIFTRALLAQDWSKSIGRIQAIEPSSGMRDVFEKTVTDSRVSVKEGTFDTTGIEDNSVDVVVIAQAFHWCPDFDKAAAEMARILKPEGSVILIWNLEDRERARWVYSLRDTLEALEGGAPQFRTGIWRQLYATPSFNKLFGPAEEKTWSYNLESTLETTIQRASSKSYIAILGAEEKAAVLDKVKAIIEQGKDKVWIDEARGTFEYPYQTLVSHFKKL